MSQLALADVVIRAPCEWCSGPIPVDARRDAVTCSQSCRQARHRFEREAPVLERATAPLRLAYADPPYPGLARRYYAHHPDYGGEVDHRELLSRLQHYDGWALSTSSTALPSLIVIAHELDLDVRVASWHRGARPGRTRGPRRAWEPVLYSGGRREVSEQWTDDALAYHARPRLTDPQRVVGAKPAAVIYWILGLLGARPGDELDDLYPGSGGVARAWAVLERRAQRRAVRP